MSMDELKQDLRANLATVKAMAPELTTPADIVRHLKDTLWPFIENVVGEMDEIDSCVGEMIDGADVLQEDSAKVFAGLISSGTVLVGELKRRLTAGNQNDDRFLAAIAEYEQLAAEASELLEEIVMPAGDDGEDDEDNDDEEDDDDDAE